MDVIAVIIYFLCFYPTRPIFGSAFTFIMSKVHCHLRSQNSTITILSRSMLSIIFYIPRHKRTSFHTSF